MTITSDAKFIISVLLITVVVIAGAAYLTSRKTSSPVGRVVPDALKEHLVREDSPIHGPSDAKVTVVEFGDFECPACGALHIPLKSAKGQLSDKSVRFVFRQFPLPQHTHAQLAAQASLAAAAQGKFWEYHDTLFEHQSNLTSEDLVKYAKDLGMEEDTFKQALKDSKYADTVQRDKTDGSALGIRSTPTLFINGTQYNGKYSTQELLAAIEAELQK